VEQSARTASLTPADLAYAAGFFDGEGHIRIQKHSSRCATFMLQVIVTQSTEQPLDWFVASFGGTCKKRLVPYKGTRKVRWDWQASSAVADNFLRLVYPYLRNKKDEADIALEFRGTFRAQHVVGGHKKMDSEIIARRAFMRDSLKAIRHFKHNRAQLEGLA
jgi:hypothetical protein